MPKFTFFVGGCLLLFSFIGRTQSPLPVCVSSGATGAETCWEVCLLCDFVSPILDVSGDPSNSGNNFCGVLTNDKWYAFTAATQAQVTFTVQASNCTNGDGLQLALYDACDQPPLVCNGGTNGGASNLLEASLNVQPGKIYYLVIDGFNADQCSYQLSASPGQVLRAPQIGAVGPITGPQKVCPGATFSYSIPPVAGATYYTWTVPPDATVNGQPGPGPHLFEVAEGTNVEITFGNSTGSLTVEPSNNCNKGAKRGLPVTVTPLPTTLVTTRLCADQYPFTLPNGYVIPAPGTYREIINFVTPLGCDSIVQAVFIASLPPQRNLGKINLCGGGSFSFCGKIYDTPGTYSVRCGPNPCDSLYRFTIEKKEAVVTGVGSLNCFNGAVTLRAGTGPGAKVWKNAGGQVVGRGDSLIVTTAGRYRLEVTDSLVQPLCVAVKEVTILEKDTLRLQLPAPALPKITCTQPAPKVLFVSNMPAVLNLPGVPRQPGLIHEVTLTRAGSFSVQATTSGGCSAVYTGSVVVDTLRPSVQAANDSVSCRKPAAALVAISPQPGISFIWKGVGFSFIQSGPTAVTSKPGLYEVTAVNPANGCTAQRVVEVIDRGAPSFAILPELLSCGNTTATLQLVPLNNIPQIAYQWTGPGGFTSTQGSPEAPLPGLYMLTATNRSNGCSQTYQTTVQVNAQFFALPAALRPDTLTCVKTSLVLSVQPHLNGFTDLKYQWTGPGGFTSTQAMPVVNVPGDYRVTVSGVSGQCTASSVLTVVRLTSSPAVQAFGGTLPCKPALLTLKVQTNAPAATFQWSGPGGFTANVREPVVNQFGTYRVTVTNTATRCTAIATAVVNASPGGSYVSLTLVAVTGGLRRIQTTTTAFQPTFAWTGPNGFTSTQRNPMVVFAGLYTVRVTDASTGCETYRSIQVPPLQSASAAAAEAPAATTDPISWKLVPNPARTRVQVQFDPPSDEVVQVRLMDAMGRLMRTARTSAAETLQWELGDLPSGLYRVVVVRNGVTEVRQLAVE
jgi:hypothetical protein